jgi:hypothetical protein
MTMEPALSETSTTHTQFNRDLFHPYHAIYAEALTNSVSKNPKVHHRTHHSSPPVPILSLSVLIHTPANLPKIHSDPILPSTP